MTVDAIVQPLRDPADGKCCGRHATLCGDYSHRSKWLGPHTGHDEQPRSTHEHPEPLFVAPSGKFHGYFGVLVGHTPLLALLGTGELWYRQGTETHYLLISGGFAEVQPDRVTILAQNAERAGDIDIARAEAAKRRAEERLASPPADMDFERARIAMLKSLIRLQVASRVRIRG